MIFSGAGSTAQAVDETRSALRPESTPRASLPTADAPDDAVGIDFATNFAAQVLDRLFHLLKRRLAALTLDWRDEYGQPSEYSHAQIMNARILECAASLDHIHAALGPDIARLCQAERELLRTRDAFLQMQRQLEESRIENGRVTASAARAASARTLGPTVDLVSGDPGIAR